MSVQVYGFSVEMTCEGCSAAVENVLKKKSGVDGFRVDLAEKKVYVTSTLSSDEVLETIRKTGKETQFLGVQGSM